MRAIIFFHSSIAKLNSLGSEKSSHKVTGSLCDWIFSRILVQVHIDREFSFRFILILKLTAYCICICFSIKEHFVGSKGPFCIRLHNPKFYGYKPQNFWCNSWCISNNFHYRNNVNCYSLQKRGNPMNCIKFSFIQI